jgi:hypothetical protein
MQARGFGMTAGARDGVADRTAGKAATPETGRAGLGKAATGKVHAWVPAWGAARNRATSIASAVEGASARR